MCEPACIRYTAGSNFACSNLAEARAVVKRTYEAAVELFAYLCRKYSLDPLVNGVIISHKEGSIRGVASNHSDPEHLWMQLDMGYTMAGFRETVTAAMSSHILNKIEGAEVQAVAEWIQEQDGHWWYRHIDGGCTKNDWEQIEGKWYHFDKDGWMQTG